MQIDIFKFIPEVQIIELNPLSGVIFDARSPW